MKKIAILILFCALKASALDFTYSTNLLGAGIAFTNVYIGTNGTDTNRDSLYVMMNKINRNGMGLDSRTASNTVFLNLASNRVNTLSNRIEAVNLVATNYAVRPYYTNATLTAANSLKIYFTAFSDLTTNYVLGAPNELIGVLATDKQSNNFTISFNTVTLTNHVLEGPLIHK